MINWLFRIDLTKPFEKYHADELSVKGLAEEVSEKLRDLIGTVKKSSDEAALDCLGYLEDLVEDFLMVSEDAEEDEFDFVINELYDVADITIRTGKRVTDKFLWITNESFV